MEEIHSEPKGGQSMIAENRRTGAPSVKSLVL